MRTIDDFLTLISSGTTPAPSGGRLSPARAQQLAEDLRALHVARCSAAVASRSYPVAGTPKEPQP